LGRTVEKYLRPNTKKGITKEQHITQSLLYRWEWVGLLKNTLRPNTKRRNHKRAAHHSIPAFIGGNWVGLLKNTLDQTQRITKEQHITQSLLYRWVGLLKKYS
jgi:hypothetical protein